MDDKGEVSKEQFDQTICREAGYDTIDEQCVKDFLQNRATKLNVKVPETSVKDILTNVLKVVKKVNGELRPTNAGILFFGKDPSDIITGGFRGQLP